MPVHMELSRVITCDIGEEQLIYLREVDGPRQLIITIGEFEAKSIQNGVAHRRPPRPLTHQLLANTIEALGGELDSVLVSELKEGTYYSRLRVKRDGELVEIDSRPSDAIAVAVNCDPPLPIYVEEDVLEEAAS